MLNLQSTPAVFRVKIHQKPELLGAANPLPGFHTKLLPCCDFHQYRAVLHGKNFHYPSLLPKCKFIFTKNLHLGHKTTQVPPYWTKEWLKNHGRRSAGFSKNKTMPTCSRLSPRPSKYWIPCWTKMEVRSFHGSRLTRYIFVESGHKQPRWDTIQTCIFPDFFVVQIETPNITLKTKNSWPMGKKNGKTQRKIQRTMKPKGECRPSAIAKRTGPTCQPQPPIKPD